MPININNAPAEIFEVLQQEAKSFHHEPIMHDENGNHHHHIPHRVYDVDMHSIVQDISIAEVQQTAWRFIIHNGHGEPHVAEIGMNETLDEHQLHFVNTGRHVDHFIAVTEAIHAKEEHLGHEEGKNYEIDLLRAGSLFVLAVWVREVDAADHLSNGYFVPLAPVHSAFEAHRPYAYEEFVPILQQVAQEAVSRLEAEQADQPSPEKLSTDEVDLTRIEGIGAGIAKILRENGVQSYADIADIGAEGLKAMLMERGGHYNRFDTSTWPLQAELAASGRWEELAELQASLDAGRR